MKNKLLLMAAVTMIVIVSAQLLAWSDERKLHLEYKEHAKFLANEAITKMQSVPFSNAILFNTPKALGNHTLGKSPQPDCQSKKRSCNVGQKIARELWEWERALDGFSGTPEPYYGCIQVQDRKIKVIVAWSEKLLNNNPSCLDLVRMKNKHVVIDVDIPKNVSFLK